MHLVYCRLHVTSVSDTTAISSVRAGLTLLEKWIGAEGGSKPAIFCCGACCMHPANLTCRRSKIIPSHESKTLSNHPANERCFALCEAAGTWRVQAQELRNGSRNGLPILGQWGSQTCSRASNIVDYLGCALTVPFRMPRICNIIVDESSRFKAPGVRLFYLILAPACNPVASCR